MYIIENLTDHQRAALTEVGNFLRSPEKELLLVGSAGTGKTYLLKTIVESLKGSRSLAVTAPTNKAVKVLSEGFVKHPNVDFRTTHSFLGLREVIGHDGKITFKPGKDKIIPAVDLLIVDEASMVSKELKEIIANTGLKVLYCGDKKQIPPVGEKLSQVFNIPNQVELTEILRQKADSAILDFVYDTSKIVVRNSVPDFEIVASNEHFKEIMYENPTTKTIGWTNAYVDKINEWHRKRIFGTVADEQEFLVGEKLIMSEPFVEDEKVLLSNSEEVEVLSTSLEDAGEGFMVWTLSVRGEWGRVYDIPVISKESMGQYKAIMQAYTKEAKELVAKGTNPALAWASYYEFKAQFAYLKYSYAITAHKSQGSTYESVAVNLRDILKNNDKSERDKIIYTVLTRAAKRVLVLV